MKKGDEAIGISYLGCFDRMEDVKLDYTNPFDSAEWLETISSNMSALKNADPTKNGDIMVTMIPQHLETCLAIVEKVLRAKKTVNIMDIGGGMGDNYCYLTYWYPWEVRQNINYYIVDTPENCSAGEKLGLLGNVTYIPNRADVNSNYTFKLPGDVEELDVVILCGTLHYMPHRKNLFDKIKNYNSQYVYVSRSPINRLGRGFFTRQLIVLSTGKNAGTYIGDIACEVLGFKQLIGEMEDSQYGIIFDELFVDYSEHFREFSEEYQKIEYRNLVFRKKT